jgi:hypothetical protein
VKNSTIGTHLFRPGAWQRQGGRVSASVPEAPRTCTSDWRFWSPRIRSSHGIWIARSRRATWPLSSSSLFFRTLP